MAPSVTYRLFQEAMAGRRPLTCLYDGKRREICPVILGHTEGEEKALVYQSGGESSQGPAGARGWKCLTLAKVAGAQPTEGRWNPGPGPHGQAQSCVAEVDLDVNPASPYRPRRRLRR